MQVEDSLIDGGITATSGVWRDDIYQRNNPTYKKKIILPIIILVGQKYNIIRPQWLKIPIDKWLQLSMGNILDTESFVRKM